MSSSAPANVLGIDRHVNAKPRGCAKTGAFGSSRRSMTLNCLEGLLAPLPRIAAQLLVYRITV
jgi:hypothetical protein